jgi:hypothetical protein
MRLLTALSSDSRIASDKRASAPASVPGLLRTNSRQVASRPHRFRNSREAALTPAPPPGKRKRDRWLSGSEHFLDEGQYLRASGIDQVTARDLDEASVGEDLGHLFRHVALLGR